MVSCIKQAKSLHRIWGLELLRVSQIWWASEPASFLLSVWWMWLLLFPFAGLAWPSTSIRYVQSHATHGWPHGPAQVQHVRPGPVPPLQLMMLTNETCALCRFTSTLHSRVLPIRAQSLSQSSIHLWVWGPVASHGLRPWVFPGAGFPRAG